MSADEGHIWEHAPQGKPQLNSIVILPRGMSEQQFENLAHDDDPAMRRAIAKDPRTPGSILAGMIDDEDRDVLADVVLNSNLPLPSLREMTANRWVRNTAAARYLERLDPTITSSQRDLYERVTSVTTPTTGGVNRASLSMVAACDLIDAIVKADQVMDPPTWDVFSDLLTRDENPFPAAKALQVALDTTAEPAEHTAADIGVLGAAAAIRKTRTTARKPRRTVTP